MKRANRNDRFNNLHFQGMPGDPGMTGPSGEPGHKVSITSGYCPSKCLKLSHAYHFSEGHEYHFSEGHEYHFSEGHE